MPFAVGDPSHQNETVRGDYPRIDLFTGAPMPQEERGQENRQEIFMLAPQERDDSGYPF